MRINSSLPYVFVHLCLNLEQLDKKKEGCELETIGQVSWEDRAVTAKS